MKVLTLAILLTLTSPLMAESDTKVYSGNDNGKACELSIAISNYGDYISLNECEGRLPTNVKAKIVDGKITIPRGYLTVTEEIDCSMVIKVNKNGVPVSATMKSGSGFSPFLFPKLNCKNLTQVK